MVKEDVEGADMDILDAEHTATDFGAGTSAGHQGDRTPPMSPLRATW